MPRAIRGVLVQCDPAIKAIIVKLDNEHGHMFIVEELDDEHLVVKENALSKLKERLDDALKDTRVVQDADFSE